MGERKYKTDDKDVKAEISSTGVLHIDSASLLTSDVVKAQIKATNSLMEKYKKMQAEMVTDVSSGSATAVSE